MDTSRYVRVAAVFLLLAALAQATADLQHLAPAFQDDETAFSDIAPTRLWAMHGVAHLVAAFALALALPAVYLAQAHKLRGGGLAAFLFALFGHVAFVGAAFIMAFATPVLAEHAPAVLDAPPTGSMVIAFLAHPLAALGMLVFMIVAFRARVLPRWATGLAGAGALLQLAGDGIGIPLGVLQAVGFAGIGLALRSASRPDAAVHASAPA